MYRLPREIPKSQFFFVAFLAGKQSGRNLSVTGTFRVVVVILRQGGWLEAMMRMEESLTVAPRLGPGKWLLRILLRFALGLLNGR